MRGRCSCGLRLRAEECRLGVSEAAECTADTMRFDGVTVFGTLLLLVGALIRGAEHPAEEAPASRGTHVRGAPSHHWHSGAWGQQ